MRKLTIILIVGLLAYSAVADKPRSPFKRHVVERSVTTNLLQQCGFKSSKEETTAYVLADVSVGYVVRHLAVKLSDLEPVPCVALGEDIRTLRFLNTHFVIKADRKVINGVPVAERLDDAKSKCTVTVLFPHPGYKQERKPQPPPAGDVLKATPEE